MKAAVLNASASRSPSRPCPIPCSAPARSSSTSSPRRCSPTRARFQRRAHTARAAGLRAGRHRPRARVGPDATRLAVGDWVSAIRRCARATMRSRPTSPAGLDRPQAKAPCACRRIPRRLVRRAGTRADRERHPLGDIDPADARDGAALGRCSCRTAACSPAAEAGRDLAGQRRDRRFRQRRRRGGTRDGRRAVIATGRNAQALDDLVRRFGPRVRRVQMSGDEAEDRKRICAAAPGPIDVRARPAAAGGDAEPVRAAVLAVRPYGRVVLMGGSACRAAPTRAALRLADAQQHHACAASGCIRAMRSRGWWAGPRGPAATLGHVTSSPWSKVNEAVATRPPMPGH